ncbi:MAG: hypothetical protein A2579_10220 [Lysobacterales bacterium RIFOXYD1_FULL_69_11]|nr:MAG: hypothetical protein A2190_10275 [Xanthomonadales bacterium RIFOXYA1_FULL_69_10]OHE88185.1 MAG: hypothetical protein A2579_10220 [Xanthomonadales bacterium RIFOXYD1_FULL_69_11]
MLFASPVTTFLLAMAPGVLLLAVGLLPVIRKRVHGVIPATALAMGLALLVLQLFVAGVVSLDVLDGLADSMLMIVGLPLATFLVSLGFLSHRSGLSLPIAAASGVIGVIGLWYLGGFVVINTACGISRNGGC